MMTDSTFTAFVHNRQLSHGSLVEVLTHVRQWLDGNEADSLLILDDTTCQQVDFDLRGTVEDVLARLPAHPLMRAREGETPARTGPGRPRLGVISREISLLPRHWEWLERQPQGASAALRRLVDEARKTEPAGEQVRSAQAVAGRFMWLMAGNLPHFEEASRALYALEPGRLEELTTDWPEDIRRYLLRKCAFMGAAV